MPVKKKTSLSDMASKLKAGAEQAAPAEVIEEERPAPKSRKPAARKSTGPKRRPADGPPSLKELPASEIKRFNHGMPKEMHTSLHIRRLEEGRSVTDIINTAVFAYLRNAGPTSGRGGAGGSRMSAPWREQVLDGRPGSVLRPSERFQEIQRAEAFVADHPEEAEIRAEIDRVAIEIDESPSAVEQDRAFFYHASLFALWSEKRRAGK